MTVIVAALTWSWRNVAVDPLTGVISANPRDRGPCPADLTALALALRLAGHFQCRVVAATAGPPAADAMLREALAAGADEALRVDEPDQRERTGPGLGELVTGSGHAVALARALHERYGVPDLLICGEPAAGQDTSAIAALLAAEFSAEQALGVTRAEPANGAVGGPADGLAGGPADGLAGGPADGLAGGPADGLADGPAGLGLRVDRRLDGGTLEVLDLRSPAVLSVLPGGRPRRASLTAVLASQRAPIPVARWSGSKSEPRPRLISARPYRPRATGIDAPAGPVYSRVLELTGAGTSNGGPAAGRPQATVIGPLTPSDAAQALLAYLRQHGYLSAGAPGKIA